MPHINSALNCGKNNPFGGYGSRNRGAGKSRIKKIVNFKNHVIINRKLLGAESALKRTKPHHNIEKGNEEKSKPLDMSQRA